MTLPCRSNTINDLYHDLYHDYCYYMKTNDFPMKERQGGKRIEELTPWEFYFFANLNVMTVFELVLMSHNLKNLEMFEITCKVVAEMIHGKSPEEIRKNLE